MALLSVSWIAGAFVLVVAMTTSALFTAPGAAVAASALRIPQQEIVQLRGEDVIVVVTGGPERIARALTVQRVTKLPLVISGELSPEEQKVLREAEANIEFHEPHSTDTETNAAFFSCAARAVGWRRAIVVSDEIHLRRAQAWFAHYGVIVTPVAAPLSFYADQPESVQREILGRMVRHEVAGLIEFGWKVVAGRPISCT